MDWPMLYTGNPEVLAPGMVFFMHMILMDSENELAMNLGETYLITPSGNERLGKINLIWLSVSLLFVLKTSKRSLGTCLV